MKKLAPVSNFQMECLTAILYAKTLSIEPEVDKNSIPFGRSV